MRVLCAGEMLVDIVVRPVERVAFENDTYQVEDIRMSNGGDANNNAMNLSKLGHQVTYLGRVGSDAMGNFVVQQARAAGINMDYVVQSQTAAQTKSLILINSQGDRTFLQIPGTSAEFCLEDCDLSLLDTADLLQIGGAFHLPRFDGAGCAKLLEIAQNKGIITSMDVTSDRTGRWKGILDPCYPHLDYFLPSIEQASMIVDSEDPRVIAEFFLNRGVKHVAVKLGSRGAYYRDAESAFFAGTYSGLQIVETTGAGDAFCSGFLTGVGEGLSPEGCVTLGTACSAFAIQAMGATAGMQGRSTIQQFIEEKPPLDIRKDI